MARIFIIVQRVGVTLVAWLLVARVDAQRSTL